MCCCCSCCCLYIISLVHRSMMCCCGCSCSCSSCCCVMAIGVYEVVAGFIMKAWHFRGGFHSWDGKISTHKWLWQPLAELNTRLSTISMTMNAILRGNVRIDQVIFLNSFFLIFWYTLCYTWWNREFFFVQTPRCFFLSSSIGPAFYVCICLWLKLSWNGVETRTNELHLQSR